jgi:uncharacterized RDD family membrane protein YckC
MDVTGAAAPELVGSRPFRRLTAFVIDYLVQITVWVDVILPLTHDRLVAVPIWLVVVVAYLTLSTSCFGCTLGDLVCYQRVIARDGQRVPIDHAMLRAFVTVAVYLAIDTVPYALARAAVVVVLGFGLWRPPARRTIIERASNSTVVVT